MTDRELLELAVSLLRECRDFFALCPDYDGQDVNNLDTRCMDAIALLSKGPEQQEQSK